MLPPPDATNPKMPIAFARSPGSVKRFTISESETAEATAPPTPWTLRATTRSPATSPGRTASEASVKSADPDQEQSPMAVEVAEPAAEQQEAAEREQVCVHHPGERRVAEAEVVLIDGSATLTIVTSRTIIRLAEAEDVEGEPAGAVVESLMRLSVSFRSNFEVVRPAARSENSSVVPPMNFRRCDHDAVSRCRRPAVAGRPCDLLLRRVATARPRTRSPSTRSRASSSRRDGALSCRRAPASVAGAASS